MDEWLTDVMALKDVEGSLILMGTGEITGQRGMEPYKAELPEIVKRLLRILSAYKRFDTPVREVEVVWQNRRIIGVADDHVIILTFCSSSTALPLVRMTLNVTLAGINDHKKTRKILKKAKELRIDHLRTGDLDPAEINLISKLQ